MDDNATIFNKRMSGWGYGERLDRSKLHGFDLPHIDELEKRALRRIKNLSDLPIHFDFVRYPYVAAWAFGCKKQYFIGYSEANEFILLFLFSRMLTEPSLFPDIGNRDLEIARNPQIKGLVGQSPNVAPFFHLMATAPMPYPRDPVRGALAVYLRTLVADFIVLHELGHILQGHLEYRDRYLGCPLLADPGRPANDEEKSLVCQSLEMYADHFATWYSLSVLKSQTKNAAIQPEPFSALFRKPSDVLYYWVFSVCVFCRLFGDQTLAGSDLSLDDHPPWRFRQRMILEVVGAACRIPAHAGVFGTETEVLATIRRGLDDAEAAMTLVTGEARETKGLSEDLATVQEYWDRLQRVWKEDILGCLKMQPGAR
jgi:hypothetical protein